ncbi:hypothetical protein BGX38DRAFT_1152998 [Terfezia claveryi]|nr:hypothetical protein BGX38DRAFT_1152998 [Terfezia claveryi]
MKLLHFIPTILLLGGSMVAAHQPMDTSNSIMERDIHPNSTAASFGEIDSSFSPRAHHPRSIFQKREVCDRYVNTHSPQIYASTKTLALHTAPTPISARKQASSSTAAPVTTLATTMTAGVATPTSSASPAVKKSGLVLELPWPFLSFVSWDS